MNDFDPTVTPFVDADRKAHPDKDQSCNLDAKSANNGDFIISESRKVNPQETRRIPLIWQSFEPFTVMSSIPLEFCISGPALDVFVNQIAVELACVHSQNNHFQDDIPRMALYPPCRPLLEAISAVGSTRLNTYDSNAPRYFASAAITSLRTALQEGSSDYDDTHLATALVLKLFVANSGLKFETLIATVFDTIIRRYRQKEKVTALTDFLFRWYLRYEVIAARSPPCYTGATRTVERILTESPSISKADHVLPVRPDILCIICRLGTILKKSIDTKTGPQRDRLIADLRRARTIQQDLLPHLPTPSALIACNLAFVYAARFLYQPPCFDSADQSDSEVDRVLYRILDIVSKVPVGHTALHTILLWPVFQVGLSAKVRATQDTILGHFSNVKGNGRAALKLKLREVWGRKD